MSCVTSALALRKGVRRDLTDLCDLCSAAAKTLEQESGVALEHPSIQAFRTAVLTGDWRNAERLLLDGLMYSAARRAPNSANGTAAVAETNGVGINGTNGVSQTAQIESVLRAPESRGWEYIKSLLLQQRYLELLEAKHTQKALSLLRSRLAPLNFGADRLQQLSR